MDEERDPRRGARRRRSRARAGPRRAGRGRRQGGSSRPSRTRGAPTAPTASSSRRATTAAMAATSRARRGSRRSKGPARARTNATFSPETTKRWERPELRNWSTTVAGSSRVSPTRNPDATPRSVRSERKRAAQHSCPRGVRNDVGSGDPGARNATSSEASSVPTAWRHRSRRSKPSSGRSHPRNATRSPASSTATRGAASPVARTRSVRPPASLGIARRRDGRGRPGRGRERRSVSRRVVDEDTADGGVDATRDRSRLSGECTRPSSARCMTAAPEDERHERDDGDEQPGVAARAHAATIPSNVDGSERDDRRARDRPVRRARIPATSATVSVSGPPICAHLRR